MLRAYKIRLYPNKEQAVKLDKTLGAYRFIYNHMLNKKIEAYKTNKENLDNKELSYYFFNVLRKNNQYQWLQEQPTRVMGEAIRQMLTAYKNFFKQGHGFPKFKSRFDTQSASFSTGTISVKNDYTKREISFCGGHKNIPFKTSDEYVDLLTEYKENIRSGTLSKTKTGKYFFSILVDVPQSVVEKLPLTNKEVGIDLGVKDFVITSDGETFENKHFFKKQEQKIKRLQRQLSKKQKGSNNRNKQRLKLAKAFERLTNQKNDYIHNTAKSILGKYDTVYMENLNVKGMLKNHHMAKAISELGFFNFKNTLIDKANCNHKEVICVDRFFPSSKTCSNCGYKNNDLKLKDRTWTCPNCGTYHDRDVNAAINILEEGKKLKIEN